MAIDSDSRSRRERRARAISDGPSVDGRSSVVYDVKQANKTKRLGEREIEHGSEKAHPKDERIK